jgi:hypothetical protein
MLEGDRIRGPLKEREADAAELSPAAALTRQRRRRRYKCHSFTFLAFLEQLNDNKNLNENSKNTNL